MQLTIPINEFETKRWFKVVFVNDKMKEEVCEIYDIHHVVVIMYWIERIYCICKQKWYNR